MPTSPTQHTTSTEELAAQLAASDSATLYVDIPELDAYAAEDMLLAEPPLHVEWDDVRGKWAVRAASADEVADAQAAAEAEAAPKTAAAAESAPKSGKTTTSD